MIGNAPRAVLALRRRLGWTQSALGARAAVSRQVISRMERAQLAGLTIGSLDRTAIALGATLRVELRWQGEQLDRLVDRAHASLQQSIAALLLDLGWLVRVERSFNHYGDRGRVDIVAFHPRLRILLIIEIKSGIGDIQETLGRLDVKVRLGEWIARDLDWTDVAVVFPVLAIGDSRAARRTVAAHDALFARFDFRGRSAVAWLRRPAGPMPTGLLWFTSRPDSHRLSTTRR